MIFAWKSCGSHIKMVLQAFVAIPITYITYVFLNFFLQSFPKSYDVIFFRKSFNHESWEASYSFYLEEEAGKTVIAYRVHDFKSIKQDMAICDHFQANPKRTLRSLRRL